MRFQRSAGILLHPTSLPGPYGIGDLGDHAYRFADFLKASKITLWQVLPLGPTGYGDSPYQCFSAFAGNPYLISPDKLIEDGVLSVDLIEPYQDDNQHQVDFGKIFIFKNDLLKRSYEYFKTNPAKPTQDYLDQFNEYKEREAYWLNDFALFMACKNYHQGRPWPEWDEDISKRKKGAVEKWTKKLSDEVEYQKFVQYNFARQWMQLKQYVNGQGIKFIGDIPIFIAFDSSDAWANRQLFTIDQNGQLEYIAGVPPDYFSATGQLWGNPLYRWKEMEADDFKWWRDRFSAMLDLVDIVRIDHFRGFEAYWQVKGGAPTAENGKWVKAPGKKLFKTVEKYLGKLPIIAEDLGVITKEVTELRETFDFPGMKILQFAFGAGMETRFLPHNYEPNSVVYTGSHDNDTTKGYFEMARSQQEKNDILSSTQKYLNYYGEDMVGELIRLAYASVADIVIFPMQDILGLGTEARMNYPSKLGGNWSWRLTWDQMPYGTSDTFISYSEIYERPKIESD